MSTSLVEQIHTKIEEKLAERDLKQAEVDERMASIAKEERDANEQEDNEIRGLFDAIKEIDTDVETLEKREAEIKEMQERRDKYAARAKELGIQGRVGEEPRTYRADNQHEANFLRDAFQATINPSNFEARGRIERHQQEMAEEYRDVATSALGGFIVPKYALDQAAQLARAGSPFVDTLTSVGPVTNESVIIPTITTGTAAAAQASQNSGVQETDIAVTNVTVTAKTIAGKQDISRQSIELGTGTQNLIINDLIRAYWTNLDYQVINSDGSSGTIEGLLQSDSVGTETYTDASPTVPEFLVSLGAAFADVTSGCYAPPTSILMAPRRWEWLLAGVGSDGRPLVQVNQYNAMNEVGRGAPGYGSVGTIRGVPVIVDGNVPTNLGAGTNEDRVMVMRSEEFFFAHDPSGPKVLAFEQAGASTLSVTAVVYGYAQFTAERRTAALSIMSGTGLIL